MRMLACVCVCEACIGVSMHVCILVCAFVSRVCMRLCIMCMLACVRMRVHRCVYAYVCVLVRVCAWQQHMSRWQIHPRHDDNKHVTMATIRMSRWQQTRQYGKIHTSRWQHTSIWLQYIRHDGNNTHVTITYIHVNTATAHTYTLIWQQYTHRDDNTHINMAAKHTSIWQQYIRQDDTIHVNMATTGTSWWQQHSSVNWQTHDNKLGNQSSKGKLFSELYSEHKSHQSSVIQYILSEKRIHTKTGFWLYRLQQMAHPEENSGRISKLQGTIPRTSKNNNEVSRLARPCPGYVPSDTVGGSAAVRICPFGLRLVWSWATGHQHT